MSVECDAEQKMTTKIEKERMANRNKELHLKMGSVYCTGVSDQIHHYGAYDNFVRDIITTRVENKKLFCYK